MRIIKLAVISFIILFIVVTGISLFIPSTVRISRATNVLADAEQVLVPVRDLQQWTKWYPGLQQLATGEINYNTKNGRPVLQVQESTITLLNDAKKEVLVELKGERGKTILNGFNAIEHPQSDSITIQWYMDFRLNWYPWEKFASMLYEKMYGATMERGLSNLKELTVTNRSSIN